MKNEKPSMDDWLEEAKSSKDSDKCGMYLVHNGVVRKTARSKVREGEKDMPEVKSIFFESSEEKVKLAIEKAKKMPGIYYVRVWLNSGEIEVGDSLMYVLVGGDIRPNVIDCLVSLVGEIKSECVVERESY